ncbi:MAG: hypothetical protein WCQ95_01450 [Bacteroidota bacterium]
MKQNTRQHTKAYIAKQNEPNNKIIDYWIETKKTYKEISEDLNVGYSTVVTTICRYCKNKFKPKTT